MPGRGRGAASRGGGASVGSNSARRSSRLQLAATTAPSVPVAPALQESGDDQQQSAPADVKQDEQGEQESGDDSNVNEDAESDDHQEADDDNMATEAETVNDRGAQKRSRQNTSTSHREKRSRRTLRDNQTEIIKLSQKLLDRTRAQSQRIRDQKEQIRQMEAQNTQLKQSAAKVQTLPVSSTSTVTTVTASNAPPPQPTSADAILASQALTAASAAAEEKAQDRRNQNKHRALKAVKPWDAVADAFDRHGVQADWAVDFLDRYEIIMESHRVGEDDQLESVGTVLTGTAFNWYKKLREMDNSVLRSWPAFREAMIKRFDPQPSFDIAETQLVQTVKKNDETYPQHLLRFRQACRRIPGHQLPLASIISKYLNTLDFTVSAQIRSSHQTELSWLNRPDCPLTLEVVSEWATSAQMLIDEWQQRRSSSLQNNVRSSPTTSASATMNFVSGTVAGPTSLSWMPAAGTTSTSSSTTPGVSPYYRGRRPNPNFRKEKEHQTTAAGSWSSAGPGSGTGVSAVPPSGNAGQPPSAAPAAPAQTARQSWQDSRTCHGCGQHGHIRPNCPNRQGGTKPKT
jgi:hypothetical protein